MATIPLTYRERLHLRKAAPSALAQWQARFQALLAEGYSHLGASDKIAHEMPELAEQAGLQVSRETHPGARVHKTERSVSMSHASDDMSAADELVALQKRHVAQGECLSAESYPYVCKRYPRLYARYLAESRQPGYASQRVPVAKDVQQLITTSPTSGERTFEGLTERERARHPDWTDRQVDDAVRKTAEGQAALEAHRREHLFGTRG